MEINFENRSTFYVSGYFMETSEETLEKDCAVLRAEHEDKLRDISDHLYFLAWMTKENIMVYLLGVETTSQIPATEGATCKEVPAGRFAVATVPENEPILATWHKFFGLFGQESSPLGGASIDVEFPFNFESFDENGVCKLWIPVKQ